MNAFCRTSMIALAALVLFGGEAFGQAAVTQEPSPPSRPCTACKPKPHQAAPAVDVKSKSISDARQKCGWTDGLLSNACF
jgi:hypothetical protein